MKKDIYFYHKEDSRENRNLYQYSKFHGKKFLKNFYISRKLMLNHKKKIQNLKTKKLIKINKIKKLCTKYEKNKKLYLDKLKKKEYSPNHYIDFSYNISRYLKKKKYYSLLSTLLKLNDLIIYLYNKQNNKFSNFQNLKKIINLEKQIIKKIINEKKIK